MFKIIGLVIIIFIVIIFNIKHYYKYNKEEDYNHGVNLNNQKIYSNLIGINKEKESFTYNYSTELPNNGSVRDARYLTSIS